MKRALIVMMACTLPGSAALAQTVMTPMPSLGATSPFAAVPGAPVGGTGLPLGAIEVASPGVSPSPVAATVGGMPCATLGSTTAVSGSTYDGGGLSPVSTTPAPTTMSAQPAGSPIIDTSGLSGMCGSGAGSVTASSTPTSATSPGTGTRTGIPLGSTEIANLGVSAAAPVPTIGVTPMTTVAPTTGSLMATPAAPAVASGVPVVTTGGISSIAPPIVPGLALGIASRTAR